MFIHTGSHYFCPINMYTNIIDPLYFAYLKADWYNFIDLSSLKNTNNNIFSGFNYNPVTTTYAYSQPINMGLINNWTIPIGQPFSTNTNTSWSYPLGQSFGTTGTNYNQTYPLGQTFGLTTNYITAPLQNTYTIPKTVSTQTSSSIATPVQSAAATIPSTALKTNEISNADKNFAKSIATNAESYIGYNEKDGSFRRFSTSPEWCADFVTYVVKESYAKQGKTVPAGFGSWRCETLKQWAIDNNKFLQTAGQNNKAQIIAQNVKPGDILILRENGASHTGIVKSVNPKTGEFTTIEGNLKTASGIDCVERNTYSPYNNEISGFIQLV